MKLTKEEELYLHWKRNYYDGNTLVPDADFDDLEKKLKLQNSDVINMVGSKIASDTVAHPSPMKSLQKINVVPNSINYEKEKVQKWIDKYFQASPGVRTISLECTLKYDGNAFNMVYKKDLLEKILSRGDGEKGQDVSHKLGLLAPDSASLVGLNQGDFEIRGEVLIKKDIYEKKYMDPENPKNARNFVAGILNPRNTVNESIIYDLSLMMYDIKFRGDSYNELYGVDFLNEYANEEYCVTLDLKSDLSNYEYIYRQFLDMKDTSPFLIDGFVIKFPEALRSQIPEKDHHPEWAMAIKFPPSEKSTYIKDIEWQLGKTGELTPVAILEPVDLDGSTVGRASMYNAGFVMNMKAFPGAKVVVVKAGEIIPKITEILEESPDEYFLPEIYKDYMLILNDIHLCIMADEVVDEIEIRKLRNGIDILGFKGIGPAACEDLYRAGITRICKFWTDAFTKEKLIESGYFVEGRSLDIIFEVIGSVQNFKIKDIIHSLQYEDAGKSVSRELGKMMSGVSYDYKSLTKKPIEDFKIIDGKFRKLFNEFMLVLRMSLTGSPEIIFDEEQESGTQIYEMTGSPKPYFNVKKDVIEFAESQGYAHGKLNKDCNLLLTDDLSSTSSKMAKARKLGVEIKTYEEFAQ